MDFDWKINGNQYQATREGYNKIDLSSISTEVAGIKALYDNETGYITFNGTSTQNYPIFLHEDINEMLVDGETWNIWQENAPSDTNHEIFLQVSAVNKTGGRTRYYTSATKEKRKSFVIDKEQYTYTIDLIGGLIANIGTLTNYKNRYMLYKGTEDKPYEQYGASPSLDYPSEIETVKDSVEIDVVNKNYLTKAQQQTKTFNNVNFEINENGEINIQGLANASGEVKFELERPCKMSDLINKIVELIVEGTHTATIGMRFLDGNNRLFELIPNSKTVTLNLDDNYINKNITAIQFYINITADYNLIIKPGIYAEFQTEFTPHQSQTAIMPIQQEMLEGDYVADVEHHEWGKIESYNNEKINTEYISTTGELSQGATVYYKLETPVDLELTEEQKAIRDTKLYTYKNITNIDVSDKLASIDVTYKKDLETMFNNIIKQIPSSTSDTAET